MTAGTTATLPANPPSKTAAATIHNVLVQLHCRVACLPRALCASHLISHIPRPFSGGGTQQQCTAHNTAPLTFTNLHPWGGGGDTLGNGWAEEEDQVKMANKFHVVQRQNKDGRLGLPVCQLDTSGAECWHRAGT
jgi:hypothetical protein